MAVRLDVMKARWEGGQKLRRLEAMKAKSNEG